MIATPNPKKRLAIRREYSLAIICTLMAEGNKTVMKLCELCAQTDPQILLHLDSMGMRGAQIFYAFIGFCDGWFPRFKECVSSRNLDMIQYVNQRVLDMKAVPDGGAVRPD